MTDGFTCTDKETLVAYVYGECEAAERRLVESHLAACPDCSEEVAGLGNVRSALGAWTVPAPAGVLVGGGEAGRTAEQAALPPRGQVLRPARWWQVPLPALGRLAAAILLFAGGAAIANLEVRYDQDGLVVRTGWSRQAPAAAQAPDAGAKGQAVAVPVGSTAPWRSDLASLERRLREEFVGGGTALKAAEPGAQPAALDERALFARVSQMIAESEGRQEREVAIRMSELLGELSAQRQNDLLRVQQGLGQLEGTTGAEVMRQRQLLNYLLTVSERR